MCARCWPTRLPGRACGGWRSRPAPALPFIACATSARCPRPDAYLRLLQRPCGRPAWPVSARRSRPRGASCGPCRSVARPAAACAALRLCTATRTAADLVYSSATLFHMIPHGQRKMLFFKLISFWLNFDQGDGRSTGTGPAGRFASVRPHRYPQLVWISRETSTRHALRAGTCTGKGTRCGNRADPARPPLSSRTTAGAGA